MNNAIEFANSLAFPSSTPVGAVVGQGVPFGLTKRELFAAMAMQGMCNDTSEPMDWDMQALAKYAVRAADALLAELAK